MCRPWAARTRWVAWPPPSSTSRTPPSRKARVEADATEHRRSADALRQQSDEERAATAAEQAKVVEGLAQGLDRLAAGVLTFRLNTAFPSHYEQLRADFNRAMDTLQTTMREVTVNATAVRSGAGEITSASDDLSRRTEQQAASLEETAAALDEITATVRKTAEGAAQSREAVGAAKGDAERSGIVVRDAVAAMSEIEGSATQIGQIIGVIDEIAFQTNLLALNAGVEAARGRRRGARASRSWPRKSARWLSARPKPPRRSSR
jgi:methyl-accepting chemotaxis protein